MRMNSTAARGSMAPGCAVVVLVLIQQQQLIQSRGSVCSALSVARTRR